MESFSLRKLKLILSDELRSDEQTVSRTIVQTQTVQVEYDLVRLIFTFTTISTRDQGTQIRRESVRFFEIGFGSDETESLSIAYSTRSCERSRALVRAARCKDASCRRRKERCAMLRSLLAASSSKRSSGRIPLYMSVSR